MPSKTRSTVKASEAGAYGNMKISLSHVVSVADKVQREGNRKEEKTVQRRPKSVKLLRENWSTMEKMDSERSSIHNTPEITVEKETKTTQQHRPESYCSLAHYYRDHYQGIKKPRKQDFQIVSGKKTSAYDTRRRPMTVSTQSVHYVDKDVSSAIFSSQHLARQVQMKMQKPARPCKSEVSVKMTKVNNFLQGIPKFSLIDNEFQELCKSKPVDRITSARETTNTQNKGYQKSPRTPSNNRENTPRVKKVVRPNSQTKPSFGGFQRKVDVHPRQSEPSRSPWSCYSRKNTEKIQVPKHIYIRERGREVVESLVEVRNQDDLDILNTLTTLHPLRSATASKPIQLFEHLRDSEVYYYPII